MEEKQSESRIRYSVILSICLIVYVLVSLSVSIPFLIKNFNKTNFKEHFAEYKFSLKDKKIEVVDIVLYSINGPVILTREVENKNHDIYHLIIEGLLSPLSEEEIESGYLTYIPKGTTLDGLTVVNGYAFVRLSRDLLKSKAISLALNQIETSLKMTGDIINVNVLVDGVII